MSEGHIQSGETGMRSSDEAIVHVIDDDEAFRVAVSRMLGTAGYRVRTYASAGEYLIQPPSPGVAGCLLLDLRMPGPSGLELQQALARMDSTLPIVFLSGYADVAASVTAMKAGARDFLTKPVDKDALLSAVSGALSQAEQDQAIRRESATWNKKLKDLTPREREVLDQVVAGRRNKQIAASLSASERTVKAHRAHIMEKMGVESVAELVRSSERWQTGDDASSAESGRTLDS